MTHRTFHDRIAPVVLLAVHTVLVAFSSAHHNPTVDEAAHIAAGLSNWRFGRFELYHVNPPLVRMCATLPLLFYGCEEDWTAPTVFTRREFDLGREFILANGEASIWLIAIARWALIPFSLAGAATCWIWTRELYGRECGSVALCLWCFSPSILAYAQLVVPDMAATSLGIIAWYLFWRWLKRPSWKAAVVTSLALGALELTKLTWIILFVVWPVTWLMYRLCSQLESLWARVWRTEAAQLIVIGSGAVFIVNCAYGFEYSFQRLDKFEFRSAALTTIGSGGDVASAANRFRGTWLGLTPVPMPANYVLGLDTQRLDFDRKLWSYLRGSWREGGWWYYYVYALAIKVPLGSWCLVCLAVVLTASRGPRLALWRDEAVLLAPAIIIVALVSSQTGFNHHIRYVLPAFPFVMVFASKIARLTVGRHALRGLGSLALASSVLSSLCIYPHSLSYFNELVGGPRNGHLHLLNSNIDWGQDVLFLKAWLERHPHVELRGLAYEYQKAFDTKVVGIDVPKPPVDPRWVRLPAIKHAEVGPRPGWYAISVSLLHDRMHVVDYFNDFEPVACAGYSIYIYHLSLRDVNCVRRKLGIDALVVGRDE